MSPKNIGPGAMPVASGALNALVSFRGFLSTIIRSRAQAIVSDPARFSAIIAAGVQP
jgi:hypothetical protein